MNPEQLARMLASGDKNQVKAAQQQLQALGYNIGPKGADGSLGKDTSNAMAAFKEDYAAKARAQQQQTERENELRASELRAREMEAQAERERQLTEREAAERSPGRQALELGKFALPIGAGLYAGHRSAEGTEARIGGMSPDQQRNMSVPRRFSPYLARSMTRFLPEAGVAFYGAEQLRESNPVLSEVSQAAGTGLLSAGLVNIGEGLAKSLTAPDVPGAPPQTPLPSSTPPQSRPAITPPPQSVPTNAQTLISAARAAGAEGKLTKADAAKYLKRKGSITDQNRTAVAKALRVSPGPNFTDRLAKKIKGLSSSRKTLPGIAMPFVAGMIGYDLATSDAEARGLSPTEKTARGLATGTAAAGMYEGGRRLANKVLSPLARGMFEPSVAMTFDPLEGGSREETAQNISEARGQASSAAPWMAENLMGIPRSEGELYSKAQVPPRNPARGLPAGADPDVAKAWRQSPRRTIIELSRSSGLDAQDIATLAGVSPDEVTSLMGVIPQRAMEMRVSP